MSRLYRIFNQGEIASLGAGWRSVIALAPRPQMDHGRRLDDAGDGTAAARPLGAPRCAADEQLFGAPYQSGHQGAAALRPENQNDQRRRCAAEVSERERATGAR